MQSRRPLEDARARLRCGHILQKRGGGGTGRPSAGFAISTIAGIAMLVLSCGDGAVEPAPPPAPVATTVTVNPSSAVLNALAETARFAAEVRDQNGQVMAGAAVAWASTNVSIASVDASGLVTAVANGSAMITATAGSVSGSATVTVAQEVSAVEVSPTADTLVAGDTLRLSAVASDANGHPVAEVQLSWASMDTLVAVVDTTGLVTGVGAGETEITATSSGVTGHAQLVVEVPAPTTVVITPDTVRLAALGDTARLTAEVRDQLGRVMEPEPVAWASGDTLVATIDSTGMVTATGNGTATITAAAGDATGSAAAVVRQLAVSVTLSPSADTIALGDAIRLAAVAFDQNGRMVTDAEFTWASRDVEVATVDALGLVRGLAEGTVTITATTGSAQGTAEISVRNPDRAALVALYNATDGPNWRWSDNWLTDAPLGDWHGVTLQQNGRVADLNLPFNNLAGPIPPELGELTDLASLMLEGNNLAGPIPPELGKLTSLEGLRLGSNRLTGTIPPELGNLTRLRVLYLPYNALTGPIPPVLGNLTKLSLRVGGNDVCMPGTKAFQRWSRLAQTGAHPVLAVRYCNQTDQGALEAFYRATDGGSWARSDGWLQEGPVLSEWYGVTADSLGRVAQLNLADNDLAGRLPARLATLTNLSTLDVAQNPGLQGPLPLALTGVPLDILRFGGTGLCAPAGATAWMATVRVVEGTGEKCPPLSDRDILVLLYETTDGTNWSRSDNWLTDAPLGNWHGVTVDENGQLVDLRLGRLTGPIPAELGNLTSLISLSLSGDLTGPIPAELGNLTSLRRLALRGDLTGPIPAELGNLTSLISLGLVGDLTGPIPAELGNLTSLGSLSLSGDLAGPIPPELGNLTSLGSLSLSGDLTGPIPPELGNLTSLVHLRLNRNRLSGSIPPELGNLTSLWQLSLSLNNLSGSIPPELGNLTSLGRLRLDGNRLSGPIPPELGSLTSLGSLELAGNNLSGSIPPALGNLTSLVSLDLDRNRVYGPIPSRLGNLTSLRSLGLSYNDLSGSIPPELGNLVSLQSLVVHGNGSLSGPLPHTLTALDSLTTLAAADTGLCAPADADFQTWLAGIGQLRLTRCSEATEVRAAAYLVQSVQSRDHPVPLVAGREALLRVFVTAPSGSRVAIPAVRATFYVAATEVYSAEIPGKPGPLPPGISEDSLAFSANVRIPGEVLRPELEMVVEIDPQRTLDPTIGVANRIPEVGRLSLDVRAIPAFQLTVVPFLWSPKPDSLVLGITESMANDPHHELLAMTRTLLPVGSMEVTRHEPVFTSHNNSFDLFRETAAIHVLEGERGHSLGTMTGQFTGIDGLASLGGRVTFSTVDRGNRSEFVIAHELGHNMNLRHPPGCDAGGLDHLFPYPNGQIGAWGYDFDARLLVPPSTGDLMSYCAHEWVSDYHFSNALGYRLRTELPSVATSRALLLWGGADSTGVPFLEPAFIVEAPPSLPDAGGDYTLTGRDASGRELFSLRFAMQEIADGGEGEGGFAFALPVLPEWEGNLASISLLGPGGSFTLDGDSDIPMAILRNPRTGQIRGVLRDPPPATQAAANAVGQGVGTRLDVLFSRGIPGNTEAWRR